MQQNQDIAMN